MTAPDVPETRRVSLLRKAMPVIVVTLLAALLGVMYLDYVIDPEKNLHNFPMALVNQDVGETIGSPGQERQVNFGEQVAAGLRQSLPGGEIDLRVVGIDEAQLQMQDGRVYGALVIPSDFSKRLGILGTGSVVPGDIERPSLTLETNPRVGVFATATVQRIGDRVFAQVDEQVGKQLTDQVNAQLAQAGNPPALSAATRLTLARPLHLDVQTFHPLAAGSGEGLTAFFYALLLLLIGVVGSMIVHTLIDSALGFVPTEYGPWFIHLPFTPISRTRTLLLKWAIWAVTAVIVAAVFLGIGKALGMSIERPLALYLYSVFAMIAVGWTGLANLAAIGSAGLLVNLILFVILGLPSSGGTVPIEATPRYFGWLATFEPMHQVFLAVRAILYFDASGPAGLTRGFWMTVVGLAIGIVVGLVMTRFYDRRGLHRRPADTGLHHRPTGRHEA
ncbi:ABC transporter permease [Nocardia sp. BMG111209]|uniref:YhgE/Pip domain-containing protein n=1 Tax=Nocardia sp. BMG111209 TaxID=1160137 RepID=UPI000378C0A0